MTDYATIEALAKRLCAEKGRDWNAKGCKRNGWRRKAAWFIAQDINFYTAEVRWRYRFTRFLCRLGFHKFAYWHYCGQDCVRCGALKP